MKKKIFLLGDVVRHVYLKPVDKTNTPHEKKGEYKVFTQKMELTSETTEEQNKDLKNEKKDLKIECSPIIKEMIMKAIGAKDEVAPDYKFERQPDLPSLNLFRVLKKFPQTSKKNDETKVYRVDQAAEYFGSELSLVETSSAEKPSDEILKSIQHSLDQINRDQFANCLTSVKTSPSEKSSDAILKEIEQLLSKIDVAQFANDLTSILSLVKTSPSEKSSDAILKEIEQLLSKIDAEKVTNDLNYLNSISTLTSIEKRPDLVRVVSVLTSILHLVKTSPIEVMKQLLDNIDINIKPELLVLYDRNSDLREYIKKNKQAQKKLTSLFNNDTTKAFVISIKENINDDKWLDILSKLVNSNKEKCIVIITADDLRHEGVDITEYGANEQYIRQIVDYLDKEPLSKIWDNLCEHLVVIFRENQALYINKTSGSYHYCQYFDRSAQTRPEKYGKMPGKFTIQVASIVKYL